MFETGRGSKAPRSTLLLLAVILLTPFLFLTIFDYLFGNYLAARFGNRLAVAARELLGSDHDVCVKDLPFGVREYLN